MNLRRLTLVLAASLATLPALGQAPAKPAGTLIDFHVDVQRSVSNDLGRATAYAEISGTDAADVARRVSAAIAAGLATAKAQAGVSARTGNSHTYPIYSKGGRTIESWRMRSELVLESRDAAALSALLGKLQTQLAVSHVGFVPAPETRRAAEDEAALEAIGTFQAKAARYAAALKKPYRIRSMTIGGAGAMPPQPLYRAAMMAAEAAPMPVEAGESTLTVTINGQIELTD
jgi:predicted secreted protein